MLESVRDLRADWPGHLRAQGREGEASTVLEPEGLQVENHQGERTAA